MNGNVVDNRISILTLRRLNSDSRLDADEFWA
jgi:hypothetical protein